jgi:hypothetical protein
MAPTSLKPSEAVEAEGFPRGNLIVTAAKFGEYQYKDKNGNPAKFEGRVIEPSMCCLLTLRNDAGQEFENQAYSVGSLERYKASKSGTSLDGPPLNKNCNFLKLMNRLVDQGYPENRIGDDIVETLVGVYAYWDQDIPQGEQRGRGNPFPQQLYQFPWGEATQGAPVPPNVSVNGTAPAAEATATDPDMLATVVGVVKEAVAGGDGSRSTIARHLIAQFDDKDQDAAMALVFSDELLVALAEEGIRLDGEQFTV